jgi:hypothetical protein
VLLESEQRFTTFDNLNVQDGSVAPAHSAVLASIPYFEAKLRDDWSGTGWNLNKKLDLHLPCPVNQDVVQAFLKCAYGDLRSLRQIEPSDAPFLQVGYCNLDFACSSKVDTRRNWSSSCLIWFLLARPGLCEPDVKNDGCEVPGNV